MKYVRQTVRMPYRKNELIMMITSGSINDDAERKNIQRHAESLQIPDWTGMRCRREFLDDNASRTFPACRELLSKINMDLPTPLP